MGAVGCWGVVFLLLAGFLLTPGLSQTNQSAPKPATPGQSQLCALLTKDEVLAAVKASVAEDSQTPPTVTVNAVEERVWFGERQCIYSYSIMWDSKWDYLMSVSYKRGPEALDEFNEVKSRMGRSNYSVERVAGLGEDAYWVERSRLYVWFKGGLLKISHWFSSFQKDLTVQLAKRALGRIR